LWTRGELPVILLIFFSYHIITINFWLDNKEKKHISENNSVFNGIFLEDLLK
jgi:hypothetical protein